MRTIRVRLNVTREGTLVTLTEAGAIVRLPVAQLPERQGTLSIERRDGETLHLPARVIRTVPCAEGPQARGQYYVTLEFLALTPATVVTLRGMLAGYGDPATMSAA